MPQVSVPVAQDPRPTRPGFRAVPHLDVVDTAPLPLSRRTPARPMRHWRRAPTDRRNCYGGGAELARLD
jgi:hypothetical protein